MTDTLNFYIGTEEKTKVPEKVLAYSIRRRATCKVNITSMIGEGWVIPPGLHQGTGFSLRRFLIPTRQNFEGLGVYIDADMLVLKDVAELLTYAQKLMLSDREVACTYQIDKFNKKPWPQSAVMLINCAACTDWQPERLWTMLRKGHDYPKFMHLDWLRQPPLQLPTYWNNLNAHSAETRLLHYTKEPEQPWYKPNHPLAHLWEQELKAALVDGAVTKADLEEALGRWGKPTGDKRVSNGLHPHYKKYLELAR
jgi:hypothetical protein